MKISLFSLAAGTVILAAGSIHTHTHAQVIDFTGSRGDFTVFYDPGSDQWDAVFRERAITQADGLTSQADQDRFAAAPEDYNFQRLNVILQNPYQIERGGTTYFATAIDHDETYIWNETIVDFGIRPRLRDEQGDQFDSFTMTLAGMTGPGDFALFTPDPIFGTTVFAYNTAENVVSYDWEPWGHEHWHWGFTEVGEYELVFNFQAQFPDDSMTGVGSKTVNFEVIPEPSTVAFLAGLGIFGVVLWRRSRRRK